MNIKQALKEGYTPRSIEKALSDEIDKALEEIGQEQVEESLKALNEARVYYAIALLNHYYNCEGLYDDAIDGDEICDLVDKLEILELVLE